jgi:hypothetical protein
VSRAAGGATLDEARAAKEKVRATLADRPEVTGIGITRHGDGYAVKVDLSSPCDVPPEMAGVPIRTAIVGHVRKRTVRS